MNCLAGTGFNTWNKFGCSVNATILTTTADLMVSTGLRDAGYEYVNSDDWYGLSYHRPASPCWFGCLFGHSLVGENVVQLDGLVPQPGTGE